MQDLTPNQWRLIKVYVNVFVTLKEATKLMEGDSYVSLSLYVPIIAGLNKVFRSNEESSAYEEELFDSIQETIENRFKFVKENKILTTAMIVDPRFIDSHIEDDAASLHDNVNLQNVKDENF